MGDFYEQMENAMQGLYFTYHAENPIWLSEWIETPNRTYSDVIEIIDLGIKHHFAAFISTNEGEINYVARARRDKTVVTKKTRVFFEKVIRLVRPIPMAKVLSASSPQMRNSLMRMIQSLVCEITANQWNAILSYLYNNDIEQHKMLVEMLDSKSKKVQDGNNRTIITSHEKDAIGLCLRIAGINNRFNDMALWDTETATTPDFLEGADNVSMREDQMIINDFTCFGDWSIIDEYKNNVAVFSDGSNRISIMNVNRTPLEETLGVDLFYHNQLSQNYIFVQYKRMVKYDNGSYRYYTKSDSNFKKDLDRMADIEKSLGVPASTIREILDYRLSSEMFYFKFCKENQEILSKDMSAGMYLPKSFVDQFVNSLGQSNVSYNTVGRYFNNTMFIEMVKTGMFGSRISQSEKLSGLIKDIITSGRSAILAIQSKDYDY